MAHARSVDGAGAGHYQRLLLLLPLPPYVSWAVYASFTELCLHTSDAKRSQQCGIPLPADNTGSASYPSLVFRAATTYLRRYRRRVWFTLRGLSLTTPLRVDRRDRTGAGDLQVCGGAALRQGIQCNPVRFVPGEYRVCFPLIIVIRQSYCGARAAVRALPCGCATPPAPCALRAVGAGGGRAGRWRRRHLAQTFPSRRASLPPSRWRLRQAAWLLPSRSPSTGAGDTRVRGAAGTLTARAGPLGGLRRARIRRPFAFRCPASAFFCCGRLPCLLPLFLRAAVANSDITAICFGAAARAADRSLADVANFWRRRTTAGGIWRGTMNLPAYAAALFLPTELWTCAYPPGISALPARRHTLPCCAHFTIWRARRMGRRALVPP